jgi:hypothetical protein
MNTKEEQLITRLTNQNVFTRCNLVGSMLFEMSAGGELIMDDHNEHGRIHFPEWECDEDGEPIEYFEPMQYFFVSDWLANRMLNHGLKRDGLIELEDGCWIWIRCGCGYAIEQDLGKYFDLGGE